MTQLFICLVTMVERYYYMTQLFICLVTMVSLRSTQGGLASLDTGCQDVRSRLYFSFSPVSLEPSTERPNFTARHQDSFCAGPPGTAIPAPADVA